MNPKYGALWICLILVCAATLLFVVLPADAHLYISYIFFVIGVALMGTGYFVASRKNIPATFALIWRCGRFLPLSILLSLCMFLFGTKLMDGATWLHIVLQLLALLWQIILIVRITASAAYMERATEHTTQVQQWKELSQQVEALATVRTGDGEKRALQKLSEALRYSDPLGTASSVQREKELKADLYLLQSEYDETLIRHCTQIINSIKERNAIVKNSK